MASEKHEQGYDFVHIADHVFAPIYSHIAKEIVSRSSMPFWENQYAAFNEIYRVLKPGGWAYIGCGLGNAATRRRSASIMKKGLAAIRNIPKRTRRYCPCRNMRICSANGTASIRSFRKRNQTFGSCLENEQEKTPLDQRCFFNAMAYSSNSFRC